MMGTAVHIQYIRQKNTLIHLQGSSLDSFQAEVQGFAFWMVLTWG